MGRALARLLAARGDRLFLLEHVADDLERSARDLEDLRGVRRRWARPIAICCSRTSFVAALDEAQGAGRFRHGRGHRRAVCDARGVGERIRRWPPELLTADFTNTVLFCEEARVSACWHPGGGTLCVFSSVAGERGRKPVVLYGAAKAGLSHYLEGLDHKFRARGLKTVCVKPGFVKTGMTAGLKPPPFAGKPDQVARQVLRAIDRGWPEVYTPAMWRWVMLAIRNFPRFAMRRIGF